MMRMDMTDGKVIFVIDPGNIQRLKRGEPLIIAGNISIMFTPDMEAFSKLLINEFPNPPVGQMVSRGVDISDEAIIRAFEACKNLPEVVR